MKLSQLLEDEEPREKNSLCASAITSSASAITSITDYYMYERVNVRRRALSMLVLGHGVLGHEPLSVCEVA